MNRLILIICLLATIGIAQKVSFNTIKYGEYTKPYVSTFEVHDAYLIMNGVDKFNLYKPLEPWRYTWNPPTVYLSDNNIRIYIYKKNDKINAVKIYGATYSNKKEKNYGLKIKS